MLFAKWAYLSKIGKWLAFLFSKDRCLKVGLFILGKKSTGSEILVDHKNWCLGNGAIFSKK